MKTSYTECDKCGKRDDEKSGFKTYTIDRNFPGKDQFDLCGSCRRDLWQWLKTKPGKIEVPVYELTDHVIG